MASDNASIKSATSKPKTPTDGSKRVGFKRPSLIIPPPQGHAMTPSPYTASMTYSTATGPTPEMYGRKASMFVFDQFNGIRNFTMNTAKSGMGIGEKCSYWMYSKVRSWSRKWFTHCFLSIVLLIYTIGGAVIFVTIEGQNEDKVTGNINKDMERLMEELRKASLILPQKESNEEWRGKAAQMIRNYIINVLDAYDKHPLIVSWPSDSKVWTMWNAIVYCATVYSTIGYGHLYPTTTTGRALTIVYAIIGIPLFLIALTDFGKLFTRGIKFVWSFVRRVYYTGSCRKARKRAHMQEIIKGAQVMYEIATFRRPSFVDPDDPETAIPQQPIHAPQTPQSPVAPIASSEETPTSPVPSNFEINDEFNLPISLALFILVSYILCGAVVYCLWEDDWDFFSSFYFVFISMSTIGFGDFVPKKILCLMVSIVYLVFGLALMSMCINVVQEKLSDTFKKASSKIRSTMGIRGEDESSIATVPAETDVPAVHDPSAVAKEGSNVEEENAKNIEKNNEDGCSIIVETDKIC